MPTYDASPPVGPIGYQPVEFLDILPMGDSLRVAREVDRAERVRARLNKRIRSNLARSAREYIAGLVKSYQGDSEDVRSIIHDLAVDDTSGALPGVRPVS
jgi:hypothetical protein